MMGKKEAFARIKINKLLEEAGWRFFDDKNGQANISLETNTKMKENHIDNLGENFEKTKNGFVDFLLNDDRGFPICVLEAKKEDLHSLVGKEQARRYAKSLNVRFVILSNGNLHYFWDLEKGSPVIITKFPTLESLGTFKKYKPSPETLINEVVEDNYIAITEMPTYMKDPDWLADGEIRDDFNKRNNLRFLRKYQIKAVKSIQETVKEGKDRFLFEMATGTGKTLTSAAVIKLFLKTGNASRVLFLVDRIELENQAKEDFYTYLKNNYVTVVYKENKDDWKKADIVVTTIQSLMFNNKYKNLFSPTDFDLVISDEAHRSLGGNSRAVFEYFVGYKLGLTATPKDYLKNIKEINDRDPREIERRQLMDTYTTFGCKSGDPTFRYSLVDGVKEGYLINPIVVDARTEITTKLLSDKGYSVMGIDDEGNNIEKLFSHKDFEKKFFSEETNAIFCKTFMENALRDPISGEIGKTIIFCVSQNHATKVTQILNEFADKIYPNKYNSDFAVQVTSVISEAQQYTKNFKHNGLLGTSTFIEGYKTSKARICVTVGMMTTGYDCQDLLNICLLRPIFSPSDFVQIKGRGTRTYTYYYKDVHREELKKNKERFKLFDFFGNCEYFEDKYDYDEVIELPKEITGKLKSEPTTYDKGSFENFSPDPLIMLHETQVGYEGMKIDRKLYEKFEDEMKNDDFVRRNYEEKNYEAIEDYIKTEIFEKPNEYLNLQKLQKALNLDRRLTLREVIAKIFGDITEFKSKDQLLEEEFQKFISIYKPENNIVSMKNLFKAYITDGDIRNKIDNKRFRDFVVNPKISLDEIKELNVKENNNAEPWIKVIPNYIKDYVKINTFLI
ncbi:DEAD/DEAH box helicase family protein [Clostridium beijerinckii]|uniref:DEAD/DEAH box helicase family protein n=2 Tax=Clostridium beijerinckii TaxID=1520 RepID=A0A7X9XS97_CLOBE|nr:DEAD/DEAH box helicase family protein [Clostridium beijerinckii]